MEMTPCQKTKGTIEVSTVQNRRLLIGGVALVMGGLKHDGAAMVEVCDELGPFLESLGYFEEAPFKYVSLIFRYGLVNNTQPEYQRILKKHGELPIAIELDMKMLKAADKIDKERLKSVFTIGTLEALIDVGRKYSLPTEDLITMRDQRISSTGIRLGDSEFEHHK